MDELGDVNMRAINDYDRVSERQKEMKTQIETLSKKYFSSVQSIRVGDKKDFFGAKEFATTRQQTTTASSEIVFNPFKINNIERIGELSEKGWSVRIRPGDEERYVITLYGFEEDPTDDWLLSFGIEKYVDNE